MSDVTERDFRMPEYRDAKAEDYERRADGKIVRKDRWVNGMTSVASALGLSVREFEIPDVVARANAVYDAAAELVEAYDRRFKQITGNLMGPIDPEVEVLRTAMRGDAP